MEATTHTSKLSKYVVVFVALAVMTAIEVTVAVVLHNQIAAAALLLILLALAVLKALLVAAFFMHLRDDTKWFTLIFIYPLLLSSLLIIAIVFGKIA